MLYGIIGGVMVTKNWQKCLGAGGQILKVRDDREYVSLKPPQAEQNEGEGKDGEIQFCATPNPPWAKKGEPLEPNDLRTRIEPWLTALVQSEHLSLLIGTGLTRAVHQIGRGKDWPGMEKGEFSVLKTAISQEVGEITKKTGRKGGNIEDQVRVVNELLRGLAILKDDRFDKLKAELEGELQRFTDSILGGEASIVTSDNREKAFKRLVNFLMSFASRTGARERLHIFTTNYDRVIEAGADVAGLRLIDRFVGALSPVFRASRLDVDMHYNPPGIRGEPRYLEGVARFTKLHGSIDWFDIDETIRRIGIPFGAKSISGCLTPLSTSAGQMMIYPNAAKDRETAAYPYVELFRDFAAAICRPNSTLICYGYSFGDDHINRVIKDALTIPSTHLVIISYGDTLGRIEKTYEGIGRHAQITLLLGNHLGDLDVLVKNYLPKPAIDSAMFRMGQLLKYRFGVTRDDDDSKNGDNGNGNSGGNDNNDNTKNKENDIPF